MRKIKLTRGIQIILVTALVLILGITITTKLSNNNVNASGETTGTECNHPAYEATVDPTNHLLQCSVCNEKIEGAHVFSNGFCNVCLAPETIKNETECTHSSYEITIDAANHLLECKVCNEKIEGAHTFENGKCTTCYYPQPTGTATECSHSAFVITVDASKHMMQCTVCNEKLEATHTFENGKCTVCYVPEQVGTETECSHPYYNISADSTNHSLECTVCNEKIEGAHTYENGKCTVCYAPEQTNTGTTCSHPAFKIVVDETSHSAQCSVCNKKIEGAHTYTDGTCTVCYRKQSTSGGTECKHTSYKITVNKIMHSAQCSLCNEKIEGRHTFENGRCTVCYVVESTIGGLDCQHQSYKIISDENVHGVECNDCGGKITQAHNFVDGKCVCGATGNSTTGGTINCQHTSYKIVQDETNHGLQCDACNGIILLPHEFGAYLDNENGTHSRTCATCSYKSTENHQGGTHDNDGKCTNCNAAYQTHAQSTEIKEYTKTETTHTPVYKCAVEGCEVTFPGEAGNHTGATHENGGKCEVCSHVYEIHAQSTTVKEYTKTETTHTPIYGCSNGCTGIFEGAAENHTGATHDNGGKCEVCEQVYEAHTQSTAVKEYTKTETTHTPIYTCIVEGCTGTVEGTAENHTGATHDNGGKCEECGQVYETHAQSTTVKEYAKTGTTHTPIYACTINGCETTFEGEEEQHNCSNWTDKGNGTHCGTCEVCKNVVTEEHKYEDGKCEVCGATEPKEECKHSYVTKKNKTQHWEECEKCETLKQGSLENHTFTNYVDNEDETHTGTCSTCKYKLTEAHSYEDGKCKDCNAKKKCEHSYVMKTNKTQHWEECKICGELKSGSVENHTIENYVDNKNETHTGTCSKCERKFTESHTYENEKCTACGAVKAKENINNNNNKDNSTADKDIPKAGNASVISIVAIVLGIIAIMAFLKSKKYKDI